MALLKNGIDAFDVEQRAKGIEPTIEGFFQHVKDVAAKGNGMKLTDEQIHRIANAPLPAIRVVPAISRWAGSNRNLTPLEDGRIPRNLRLDEMDGDRS